MGTSYYSKLICGVVLSRRRIQGTVVKYDENTGEPYDKAVYTYEYFVKGTNLVLPELADSLHDELSDSGNLVMSEGIGYFGVVLAEVDVQYNESQEVPKQSALKAPSDFVQLMHRCGFDDQTAEVIYDNLALHLIGYAD